MTPRRYENFDLLVEQQPDGTFRSRVTSSPVGEGATASFAAPFDGTALENLLLKLDPGRSQMRRASADPRPRAAAELGGGLFEAAFGDEVLLAWTRSQDAVREAAEGLRLRLQLTDAPALAGLPWELLHDRRTNSYPAQSERTPVVRYLEVPQPPRPLTVDGPLRILVVLSSPTDLPELDIEAEWRRLQDVLAPRIASGAVCLDRLPSPTTAELSAWLRTHEVHVLHVIGHGDYDETQQEGVLYFADAYGRSVAVPPGVLGPYLHDHDPLRLVFLNACQSGRLSAGDPFSGMAQRLVQQDCTAVVAMQFPISDAAAVAFTGEFYAAVVDGMPVDQAVTSARKALLADFASEWATPVLYLNAPDGQVFETGHATTASPAHTVPAAPPPAPKPAGPTGPTGPTGPSALSRPGRGRLIAIAAAAAAILVVAIAFAVSRATSGNPSGTSPSDAVAGGSAAPGAVTPQVSPAPSASAVAGAAVATPSAAAAQLELKGPQFPIYRVATPPTIDGDASDWPTLPQVVVDQRVEGDDNAVVKAVWTLAWDTRNLYVYADATDPQVTQTHAQEPARIYLGDSIGMQFGVAAAPADAVSLDPGDVDLAIAPMPDGTVVTALATTTSARFDPGSGGPVKGVVGRTRPNGHGYSIEAAIPWTGIVLPWSTVGFTTPVSGQRVGMNLFVNDAVASGPSTGDFFARVSNNRNSMSRNPIDGSYRLYWGVATLQG